MKRTAKTKAAPARKLEPPRIRYSLRQAAKAIGISRRSIYNAVNAGRLKAVPLGGDGALGVSAEELRRFALGEGSAK